MNEFSSIIIWVSSALLIAYSLLVFRWMLAWIMYKPGFSNNLNGDKAGIVSVIVAVRDESAIINDLLDKLTSQEYHKGKYEVIICDDFSIDDTIDIVKRYALSNSEMQCRLICLPAEVNSSPGKKAAIARGIEQASGEIIITTDADCSMGKNWIGSFVPYFDDPSVNMVSGCVRMDKGSTLVSKLQSLEFAGLIATGAASVILKRPLMCNGANVAYLKSAYHNAAKNSYGVSDPSGDDTYLMLSLWGQNKDSIVFNKNEDGIVTTQSVSGLNELLHQRIRWASKVKKYKESYIKITGLFLFCIHFVLLALVVCAMTGFIGWLYVGEIWLLKLIIDLVFLLPFLKFTRQLNLLTYYLQLQILYPLYSVIGGILSISGSHYIWKGRKYKSA